MARRGYTLLELVVVICILGLLLTLAAERLFALRADAERAALGQVLGSLRVAVSLQMLACVLDGRDAELPALARRNPVEYLDDPPINYVGEFDAPDPSQIAPGRWYFDRKQRFLVYRVRYAKDFQSRLDGPPRARFRVQFSFADRNRNGRFDPQVDGVGGMRVVPVEPYGWCGLKSQCS